jgi:hypothetical protein
VNVQEVIVRFQRLAEARTEALSEVAPTVEQALRDWVAPGKGNGWAPGLKVRATHEGLEIDSGDPARLPKGLPLPEETEAWFDEAIRRRL